MSRAEHLAKKTRILELLEGFPSLAGLKLDALIEAMATAVKDYSVDAVTRACGRLLRGEVDRNGAYPPTAAELAMEARKWHEAMNPKLILLHNGVTRLDFGTGVIKTAGLTTEEQDYIIRQKGIAPNGQNMALLTHDEIRASMKALPAPDKLVSDVSAKLRSK